MQPEHYDLVDPSVFVPGLRVACLSTGRIALVVGVSEFGTGVRRHVPVIIEGSTRQETWPAHTICPLDKADQPVPLGGRFKAPPGYPLIPPPAR